MYTYNQGFRETETRGLLQVQSQSSFLASFSLSDIKIKQKTNENNDIEILPHSVQKGYHKENKILVWGAIS